MRGMLGDLTKSSDRHRSVRRIAIATLAAPAVGRRPRLENLACIGGGGDGAGRGSRVRRITVRRARRGVGDIAQARRTSKGNRPVLSEGGPRG